MSPLVIRSDRVVLPDGVRPAAIHIRDGLVDAVRPHGDVPAGVELLDAGPLVVLPGLVDSHVHINDPGRAEWEGIDTATRAAAAGGVTTLIDMPLNSIPSTTTVAALAAKRDAIRGRCHVDVGCWGGVVPGNEGDLEPLARAGVRGFKCFLCPAGVDEFAHVSEGDLRKALPVLGRLGLPLLAHAEDPGSLQAPDAAADPRRYSTWLLSRPAASEQRAIDLLIRLAAEFAARVHIVHLSAAPALEALRAGRRRGVPVTVETCPHYLTFDSETIAEVPEATRFKCAPPIRTAANRERLWRGLVDGDIDLVATDHSPAPAALKGLADGDFLTAWGGIASLQVGLPAVWTEAARRGVPLERVVAWMSTAPARLAGLKRSKGEIAEGHDADLVIFDPDSTWTVAASTLFHRHPVSAYDGRTLRGRVMKTLLRGDVIFSDGKMVGQSRGRLL